MEKPKWTRETIGKVLIATGQTLLAEGFPEDPLIIQSDPGQELCMFVALWRNVGAGRELTVLDREIYWRDRGPDGKCMLCGLKLEDGVLVCPHCQAHREASRAL